MHINIQPIEKADQRSDYSLDVHSVFYTIQGEGPLTGHPAVFVRLAGCNLQCPYCDTDYTSKRERMSPEALVRRVQQAHPGPRLVVITGGEPFRQDISLLCMLLMDTGYDIQVETNGTLPPPPGWPAPRQLGDGGPQCWIVVSPKTGKVHQQIAELAVAWKYVLSADSVAADGLPSQALGHTAHPYLARPPAALHSGAVYVQPADMQDAQVNARNLQAALASCMAYGYTFQLQVHKLIGVE